MVMRISESVGNKLANMSFVCACLVVAIHTMGCDTKGSVEWFMWIALRYGVTVIAVPWFFLCSGFLLAGRVDEDGWWKLVCRKRFRTLLLPYLIWCVILFGICQTGLTILQNLTRGDDILGQTCLTADGMWILVKGIVISPSIGPLWYVRTLLIFVLLSPVISRVAVRLWGVIVLFAVYITVNPGYVPWEDLHMSSYVYYATWHLFSLQGLAYFALGIWIRTHRVKMGIAATVWLSIVWIASVVLCCAMSMKNLSFVSYFVSPIVVIIPSGMWLLWRMMPERRFACSNMAFPIYILHTFFCWHLFPALGFKGGGAGQMHCCNWRVDGVVPPHP